MWEFSKDGEFNYNDSCIVIFKLGGVLLGEIDGTAINNDNSVLPADLIGVQRDNTSNEKVIKLIQFLQSIDNDNNPDNNIVITEETRKAFEECVLDFSKDETHNDQILEVIALINKQLVSKEDALKHYKGVLENRFDITLQKDEPIIEETVIVEEEESFEEKIVEFTPIIEEMKLIIEPIEEIINKIIVVKEIPILEPIIKPTIEEEKVVILEEEIIEEVLVIEEVTPIVEEEIVEITDVSPDEKVVKVLPIQEEVVILEEEIIEEVLVIEEVTPIVEEEIVIDTEKQEDIIPEEKVVLNNEEVQEEDPIVEPEPIVEEIEIKKVVSIDIESSNIQEDDQSTGFSYENQRDVNIFISSKESLSNKQVLLYEDIEIVSTPVGDLETYKNKIISTVFNTNGELNLTYTLGNHITSIWLVIPFYNINMEVPIQNNNIHLTLNEEEI